MEIFVENVRIKLTKEQLSLIEKARNERIKCINSFAKMLKNFGFKPSKGNKNCFEHEENNWWAEIQEYGYYKCVWMVGEGLQSAKSIPGGWQYGSPKEIEKELIKYYESKNQNLPNE